MSFHRDMQRLWREMTRPFREAEGNEWTSPCYLEAVSSMQVRICLTPTPNTSLQSLVGGMDLNSMNSIFQELAAPSHCYSFCISSCRLNIGAWFSQHSAYCNGFLTICRFLPGHNYVNIFFFREIWKEHLSQIEACLIYIVTWLGTLNQIEGSLKIEVLATPVFLSLHLKKWEIKLKVGTLTNAKVLNVQAVFCWIHFDRLTAKIASPCHSRVMEASKESQLTINYEHICIVMIKRGSQWRLHSGS